MSDFPVRIMHVDDDPMIHAAVKKSLHLSHGVNLKYCRNGQEMLDSIESFDPDLILLDLSMKDYDGIDALRDLKNKDPHLQKPIIFLTGYTKVKMIGEYKRLGVIGIIHKPIQTGTLPERIRYMWEAHKIGKEPDLG